MARETVAEREEREKADKLTAEKRAANAKASREAASGATHLEVEATEEEVAEANEAAAEAAKSDPPQVEPPVTSVVIHDPEKDVYEEFAGNEALKAKGITPAEALETVVIKSNAVATGPIPRPDNELKRKDGTPMYRPRDVITANGITVMTCDRSTYRPPGPSGAEQYLVPGTIIKNFKGVLSKVHAVIDPDWKGPETEATTDNP